ncbi:MAG: regulatory signaling modulator protein AmpE, partial [Proteobacteria bacterium]|nr:regulatory signaling modulator protein AmpE [Pseudomonadota bacterium]
MLMETVGRDLERRLNRESRPQSVRFMRGVLVALLAGLFAYVVGCIVRQAASVPYGWGLELVFLSLCINFMTPLKLVRQILGYVHRNESSQAAEALQPYLAEPLNKADSHALIRKTVEFIAISLNQFLAAPVFWFLMAGPVGLSACVVYAALYRAFGLLDNRRKYFGRAVRALDWLFNIVPAFLTALLLCVSALFVSKSNPLRAVTTMLQQGGPYLNWPKAAMAGGLCVTLGGPVRYSADYAEEQAWIGPSGSFARLTPEDLERAAMLQYVAFICLIGLQ